MPTLQEAYVAGFKCATTWWAIWKDGTQVIGVQEHNLKDYLESLPEILEIPHEFQDWEKRACDVCGSTITKTAFICGDRKMCFPCMAEKMDVDPETGQENNHG